MQPNLRRNDLVVSPIFGDKWKNYEKDVAEKLSDVKVSDPSIFIRIMSAV